MNPNKYSAKIFAISILALLFNFQNLSAHWSTKGPYGGHVSAYTVLDTALYVGSPTGGVYSSTNTQFTGWNYRNYTGLTSGQITALGSIGYKLIAAAADSGIYISNNKGVAWAASNSGLTNLGVLSVASGNGHIFAGTDGDGVFISTDSGATWAAANTGLTNLHVTVLLAMGDTLIAGTAGGGTFASVNGGGLWLAVSTGLTDMNITAIAFSITGGSIFAATPSGVFQATLSLPIWTAVNTNLGNTNVNALLISGDSIYAGTNAGVYYSALSSVSWAHAGSITDTVKALSSYGNKIFAGTANRGNFKATLGTYTWTAYNTGFNNLESYAIAALDSTVLVANEQGVFVCKNYITSAVYVVSNNGLADSLQVNALGITANHTLYAGTANNGIYVSTDTGATWATANTGLTNMAIKKLLVTGNKIYAVTEDGNVYSTLQSAINWSLNSNGLATNLNITSIANAGDTIFVGSPSGVYMSIAGGNWTSAGLSQNVTSLAVVGSYVFAGTAGNGVYKAPLSSITWTTTAALPSQNITALGASGGYVLVAYYGGGRASCNNGQTWHDFNVYLYNPNYSRVSAFATITPRVYALNPHHGPLSNAKTEYPEAAPDSITTITAPSNICAGSTITLSVASDMEATGYTWALPNGWSGASSSNTISVTVDSTSGSVSVAAVNGCGLSPAFADSLAVDICTGINETAQQAFSVYPNPFANQICLTLKNFDSNTFVMLTDITGKVISTAKVEADVTLVNTTGLQNGIYLLNIISNGKNTGTQKIVKAE